MYIFSLEWPFTQGKTMTTCPTRLWDSLTLSSHWARFEKTLSSYWAKNRLTLSFFFARFLWLCLHSRPSSNDSFVLLDQDDWLCPPIGPRIDQLCPSICQVSLTLIRPMQVRQIFSSYWTRFDLLCPPIGPSTNDSALILGQVFPTLSFILPGFSSFDWLCLPLGPGFSDSVLP